jgi:hypothetical protein
VHALRALLEGRELPAAVAQACALLATVVGQDADGAAEGVFRIARRVARDQVISTVDPEACHGHKISACGFDDYKGHAGIDPDSELVTVTWVTLGNTGDVTVAEYLIARFEPTASSSRTRVERDDQCQQVRSPARGPPRQVLW